MHEAKRGKLSVSTRQISDSYPEHSKKLFPLLQERIVILDGAMGTMIFKHTPTEADYRGERFSKHHIDLKNFNEIFNLVNPKLIEDIHTAYLDAGADIIETNTFNAQAISIPARGR